MKRQEGIPRGSQEPAAHLPPEEPPAARTPRESQRNPAEGTTTWEGQSQHPETPRRGNKPQTHSIFCAPHLAGGALANHYRASTTMVAQKTPSYCELQFFQSESLSDEIWQGRSAGSTGREPGDPQSRKVATKHAVHNHLQLILLNPLYLRGRVGSGQLKTRTIQQVSIRKSAQSQVLAR